MVMDNFMNRNKGSCFVFFFFYLSVFAQQLKENTSKETQEPKKDAIEIYRPVDQDYLYGKGGRNFEVLDTALSLEKYYQHNFLRKDYFGFMPFANIGQPLNPLVYRPELRLLPDIGFSAKRYSLVPPNEVNYFDVKTPLTQFFYENGIDEGRMLEALFSQSPHKRMNYSLKYSRLRSLGDYNRELSASHVYLATFNYSTPGERYKVWTHFLDQDVNNQENGGVQNISDVLDKEARFRNRKNITVNLPNADSQFKTRRYYLKQSLNFYRPDEKNTLSSAFFLNHEFRYDTKNYQYQEKEQGSFFSSDVYSIENHLDKSDYKRIGNELTLALEKEKWHIESGLRHDRLTYRSFFGDQNDPSEVRADVVSLLADLQYHNKSKWFFKVDGRYALSGRFAGDFLLNLGAEVPFFEDIKYGLRASLSATHPDFNAMNHKSFYKKYNYDFLNVKPVNNRSLHLYLLSKKYLNLYVNLYNVDRYTYFDENSQPIQYDKCLNVFDIQTQSVIKFGPFGLENHLQYQQVASGSKVLSLPNFIGRASLFYENVFFEKSLFLQTGVTLNYFSKFKSRVFFPVLNEFILPSKENTQIIGGYPFLDYFLNFKVFRMQFYIRAQHLNAIWGNNNYFSAPAYPATDFTLRMGIVWNLFT